MSKLLSLTPNCWLIQAGVENSGLLFQNTQGFLFLSTSKRLEFKTFDEVRKRFGTLVTDVSKIKKAQQLYINGYPVKHQDMQEVSVEPPLYVKEGGKAVFAAGYWAIRFAHGWTLAYCPKQNTLQENEHSGPYRHRLEALSQINTLNNHKNMV